MGQFNRWTPELMEPFTAEEISADSSKEGVFFYKARILSGFTFRYYFRVDNEDAYIVDETKPTSKSRFNKMTNTVIIKSMNCPAVEDAELPLPKIEMKKTLSFTPDVQSGFPEEIQALLGRIQDNESFEEPLTSKLARLQETGTEMTEVNTMLESIQNAESPDFSMVDFCFERHKELTRQQKTLQEKLKL